MNAKGYVKSIYHHILRESERDVIWGGRGYVVFGPKPNKPTSSENSNIRVGWGGGGVM
jgi:hypothetical protein